MPSRNSTHMLPYGYPVYIYLILLNIYNMNGSVLPTTARSQIKRGGGKGRFGYVWLILGKDFKISQKIVSQS